MNVRGVALVSIAACVSTVGSYQCECKEGYTLSSNRYSCIGESVCSPVANQCTTSVSVEIFDLI